MRRASRCGREALSRTSGVCMNELNLEQIGRLREKLLELQIFKNEQDRRRLIGNLRFWSSIPPANRPDRETEAIIERCSELSGFAVLLDALAEMTPEPLDDFI